MGEVRNSRTMSAGEADTINWGFEKPLEAISEDARIQGVPVITQERKTGSVNLDVSQVAVDSAGKVVSARVAVPAGSVNGRWELTATAATSTTHAYSTRWRIVQS